MSPLPERRKSPEELAKLRESLGIPAEGAPAAAPGVRPDAEPDEAQESLRDAVFQKPEEEVAEEPADAPEEVVELAEEPPGVPEEVAVLEPEPEPLEEAGEEPSVPEPRQNLRKSASLPVDQPKPVRHREDGSLPVRRHTDEELMRLRRMDAGPMGAAVQDLARRTLRIPVVIFFYLLAAIAVGLLLLESLWLSRAAALDLPFDWLRDLVGREWYGTALMATIGGLSLGVLLIAGWVAWRRPLSRHHAGFLTIIAVLVLVFGFLYFFPELHAA